MQNFIFRTITLVVCLATAAHAQIPQSAQGQSIVQQLNLIQSPNRTTTNFPNKIAALPLSGVSQEWAARYDMPGNADDVAVAGGVDLDGNVFVTGYRGMLSGAIDYVTVKYDADGNFLWMHTYDGPGKGTDIPTALAVDGWGNAYVTGFSEGDDGTGSDFATIRYSPAGTEVWVARYDGPASGSDMPVDIAVNGRFRVVVTGSSQGNGSGQDYVTIRYNKFGESGNWVERWNGPQNGDDEPADLVMDDECVCVGDTLAIIDTQHFFYVTGRTKGAVNGDDFATIGYQNHDNPPSRLIMENLYDSTHDQNDNAVALTFGENSGALYVTGNSTIFVNNLPDFGIETIKYDLLSGNEEWSRRVLSASPVSIASDETGVYVAGRKGVFQDANFVVMKWAPDGTFLWDAFYNGPGNHRDQVRDMTTVSSDGIVLTGSSLGDSETNGDYATVRYDKDGNEKWLARYDGMTESEDDPVDIFSRSGNIYVTGSGNTSISFFNQDIATVKYSDTGNEQWRVQHDSPGNSDDFAMAATTDAAGNTYITGYTQTIGTSEDYLTAKFNPDGVRLWAATYNGANDGHDNATAIAVDATGNVYVTGFSDGDMTNNDYATVKYDANGTELWVRRYDGSDSGDDEPVAMAVDAAGNIYVTGTSPGSGTLDDFATIKYDADGNELWVARYDNPAFASNETANDLGVDADGNVFVTGTGPGDLNDQDLDYATVKYNADGTEQWVAYYDGTASGTDEAAALAIDDAGQVVITGTSTGSFNTQDYLTVKYNADGDTLWTARYDPTLIGFGPRRAMAVAIDGWGNTIVTGYTIFSSQYENFATVKYDKDGIEQWVRFYDGPQSDEDTPYDIAVDENGAVYVTGLTFIETIENPDEEEFFDVYDFATVAYDSAGNELWNATYDGPPGLDDGAVAVGLDDSLRVYVAGYSSGDRTDYDFAVVKYRQSPTTAIREAGVPPQSFQLSQNFPNPFNPATSIRFSVPHPVHVCIRIYDLLGSEIRELENAIFATGNYIASWNGLDKFGRQVASGVYFMRMHSGDFTAIRKIALVR